jgi:predicted ATPase/class 3 adenylate cyclase
VTGDGLGLDSKKTLPSGTITFLLTDVEGSTRLWEGDRTGMARALARHDVIIADAVAGAAGTLVKSRGEGDSTFAVFSRATDAVCAALSAARGLASEAWSPSARIAVRLAVHSGEVERRDGDYYGPAVNRCARLRAVAHGGQVLVSQATAELVREQLPDGASLADLGLHRLKDLAAPEHIFQLCHAGLIRDFPPLRSLDALPHNLPIQLTTLVGREHETVEVRQLLADNRLVTLTGAAGCGKTRLALQVAVEVTEEFPGGVWFADLSSLSDPALVLPAVAQALGVNEAMTQRLQPDISEPARPLAELVVEQLGDKRLLIVLDNCEHLLGACAQVTEMLLRASLGVRVLCTSREPLGVGVETTWRVPSLAVPDPEHVTSSDQLSEYDAARLFLERAGQREAGFVLSLGSASAVAQICQRLDGIPLAIELAAARIRVLTPEQIASRLDDRFTLLTGGSRVALERHQTLRAAVDWSYDTLSEAERALLRRISVFAGGFSLEAAEAACAFGVVTEADIVDLLGQLIDKSLLTMQPHRERARYRLLETIRQYGREQLVAAGEVEEQRSRHQQFFLTWAEQTQRRMWGPDQGAAMEEVNDDADNVAQAVAWSLAREKWDVALRLAGALDRYWSSHRPSQGRRLLEEALQQAPAEATFARAHALSAAGLLASELGDGVPARRHLEESLELYRRLGVRRGVVWSLINLAILDGLEDRLHEMGAALGDALPLARETGHPQTIGWALNNQALLAGRRGDYDQQRSAAEEALALFRRSTDQMGIGFALVNLANALQGQGEYLNSIPLIEEALAVVHPLSGWAPGRLQLGHAALARGDLESAKDNYLAAADAALDRAMPYQYVLAVCYLGEVALAAGDLDEASARYAAALGQHQDRPPPALLCTIASGCAKLAMGRGKPDRAARFLGAVEAMRLALGICLTPVIQTSTERCEQLARQALGERDYEAVGQAGAQLSIDQTVTLVRSEVISS